jgi:transglutaminase-like putative cysteine protease
VARLGALSAGRAGTIQTLKHMRDFVRASQITTDQKIRNQANKIFSDAALPPRDWNGEIAALHAFVRDHIRYVRDPVDLELVQTPEVTLEKGYGDCDDKSTLLAALLTATGHPARLTVVGMNGGPFSHVLAETKTGERWVPLETIIDKPVGWFPPGVTSKYSLEIRGPMGERR